jgi:dTDP-4-dehydrorhamnose reductase
MRAVVVGAGGQLGQAVCRHWPGEWTALGRDQCDLRQDESSILRALQPHQAEICINCAAYNFVDQAESDAEAAFAVNAWGVHKLAKACQKLQMRLVHVSTDYVFGLDPYTSPIGEDTAPGPVNIYGLSKLTGEYLARQTLGDQVLIIRTCGLYGHRGSGGKGRHFVETMLRLAQKGQTLRVVHDQVCTPSLTDDVAEALIRLVERNAHGVYHVVNSGSCSWYEFAEEIFRLSGLSPCLEAIRSVEYPAVARRPHYSVLSTAKMQQLGLPPLRPWQDALAAYLSEIGYRSAEHPR